MYMINLTFGASADTSYRLAASLKNHSGWCDQLFIYFVGGRGGIRTHVITLSLHGLTVRS